MKKFFSVFSGTLFQIPESHVKHMDCGQVPLTEFPSSDCKKCHGRGWTGTEQTTGHYEMCRCLLRLVEQDRIVHKHVHDIRLDPKYNA